MIDSLWNDIRYSLRALRRAPVFSLAVVAILALAIGANTAIVSVLNAIVFRSLDVDAPEQLAAISATGERSAEMRFIYDSTFSAFRERQRSFQALAMYSGGGALRLEARGVPVDGEIEGVSPEYFDMLGVRPLIGRLLVSADAQVSDAPVPVVVLGYAFWRRQFGADPNAIGDILKVDGQPLEIVGVTPRSFHGLYADRDADFFVSLPTLRQVAGTPQGPLRARNVIGRLGAGVTIDQARAELDALWPSLIAETMPAGLKPLDQRQFPTTRIAVDAIAGGFSSVRLQYRNALLVLAGLTSLLLLIGCVNLSGLMLSRSMDRRHQIAVRVALGASRGRVVQQLFVESGLLSGAGGLLALPVAWVASATLGGLLWNSGSSVPLAMSMTPDARVFAVDAIVAIGASLLIGVLPAWFATRPHRNTGLQPERAVSASIGRLGRGLLVLQVALSLMLLVGASLFSKSLANVRANDATFPVQRIVSTRLWLQPGDRGQSLGRDYYFALSQRLARTPGVESVGFSMNFPSYFNFARPAETLALSSVPDHSSDVAVQTEIVSPRFFDTVGISRVRGRDFTWNDDARTMPAAIVNVSLARRLFPSGGEIGQHLRAGLDPTAAPMEIVGVVSDAAVGNIRDPHVLVLFRPLLQDLPHALVPNVEIRAHVGEAVISEALTRSVAALGHHFVRRVVTLEEQVDRALLRERLIAGLSACFAGVALLLACVGIYGLIACAVARRTREIGIRMALGASHGVVLGAVLREAISIVIAGIAIGVPCALGGARLIRSFLYGLSPNDPPTLLAAAGLFLFIGVCAGSWPAYRASTIDPMIALRDD